MNLERFSVWLAIVANLGVVGGMVLLVMELRQNTQIVRAQSTASLLMGQTSAETAFMGDETADAFAIAVSSPETLTDAQMLRLWAYLNASILAVEQTYAMYSLDLATEEDFKTAAGKAADWIDFPFGRIWWKEMKSNYPADLAREIDAKLAGRDPNYLLNQFEGMKKGLRELRSAQ